jgi:hypothetical protein
MRDAFLSKKTRVMLCYEPFRTTQSKYTSYLPAANNNTINIAFKTIFLQPTLFRFFDEPETENLRQLQRYIFSRFFYLACGDNMIEVR